MEKEGLFFECLNSFERLEKPSQVASKCERTIEAGLNPVDEAIVHGLLMSIYAKQKDLEKAQEKLLRSREAIGKIIGLSGQELQMFIHKHKDIEYRHLLDNKVDCKENIVKNHMLSEIATLPLYPTSFLTDVSDKEKRSAALELWSGFPSVFDLYSLLGNLWSGRDIDYAIKCFKIVAKNESHDPAFPPTVAELMCGYKLGKLYKDKGDIHSATRELKKVLSLSAHPERRMDDETREFEDYWIAKAREELADIE